jgi:hypothetical protein
VLCGRQRHCVRVLGVVWRIAIVRVRRFRSVLMALMLRLPSCMHLYRRWAVVVHSICPFAAAAAASSSASAAAAARRGTL